MTFDLPSNWTAPQTKAVKVDDQGHILVAFDIEAGHDRDTLLMRFNQDGKLDTNFGVAGYLFTDLSPYDDALNEISFASTGRSIFLVQELPSNIGNPFSAGLAKMENQACLGTTRSCLPTLTKMDSVVRWMHC